MNTPINEAVERERQAFEAWARQTHKYPDTHFNRYKDFYTNLRMAEKWAAWQARAALPPPIVEPMPASTLGQQVARAQAEFATWSPEKRASVRLEGSGQYTTASAPSDGAADARDAGRYRWLRDPDNVCGPNWLASKAPAELDAAIDAAIASTHTTTGGEKP